MPAGIVEGKNKNGRLRYKVAHQPVDFQDTKLRWLK
jgi:hypothetical protein